MLAWVVCKAAELSRKKRIMQEILASDRYKAVSISVTLEQDAFFIVTTMSEFWRLISYRFYQGITLPLL